MKMDEIVHFLGHVLDSEFRKARFVPGKRVDANEQAILLV